MTGDALPLHLRLMVALTDQRPDDAQQMLKIYSLEKQRLKMEIHGAAPDEV